MKAGKLRHYITIETPTRNGDGQKGYSFSWSTLADVWADIRPTSSSDRFSQNHVYNGTSHQVEIRSLAGVTTKERIKFGTRYFTISGVVNEDERNQRMTLSCDELQPTKGNT